MEKIDIKTIVIIILICLIVFVSYINIAFRNPFHYSKKLIIFFLSKRVVLSLVFVGLYFFSLKESMEKKHLSFKSVLFLFFICVLSVLLLTLSTNKYLLTCGVVGVISFIPILASSIDIVGMPGGNSTKKKLGLKKIKEKKNSLIFRNNKRKKIIIQDFTEHTLATASSGSGKTVTFTIPTINQLFEKGCSSSIVDYKSGELLGYITLNLLPQYPEYKNSIYPIDFKHPLWSKRINLLSKEIMKEEHIEYFSQVLASSISRSVLQDPENFFNDQMTKLLNAFITYSYYHHEEYCSIPFITELILSIPNPEVAACILSQNETSKKEAMSFISAVESGASDQIAGVFSTLQGNIRKFRNPITYWILSHKSKLKTINIREDPASYVLVNDESARDMYLPILSTLQTFIIDQNSIEYNKRAFMALIDEFGQITVNKISSYSDIIRSKNCGLFCLTQTYKHLANNYGDKVANSFITNFNYQLYGRTKNEHDIKRIQTIFGKEKVVSLSENQSQGSNSQTKGQSVSEKQEDILSSKDIVSLGKGNFLGAFPYQEPFFKEQFGIEKKYGYKRFDDKKCAEYINASYSDFLNGKKEKEILRKNMNEVSEYVDAILSSFIDTAEE